MSDNVDDVGDDFAAQVSGVAALADPVRRDLYLHVVSQVDAVSRDQAAAATGVPRHTAKFHLDRLVDEGLLATEYRRLSGRSGPGAGRPAKLYRRADRQVTVSLPQRQYELASQVLADAVEAAAVQGTPVTDAVASAADEAGRRLAAELRAGTTETTPLPAVRSELAPGSPLEQLSDALARCGYEPHVSEGRLVLANCPFHNLARRHTRMVCGMNLGLLSALAEELGHGNVDVRLDPGPDRCCVTIGVTPDTRHGSLTRR